jgi:hypothetical protein
LQQELQAGNAQSLETVSGAAAAVSALLGDVVVHLRQAQVCVGWLVSQLSYWHLHGGKGDDDETDFEFAPVPSEVLVELESSSMFVQSNIMQATELWSQLVPGQGALRRSLMTASKRLNMNSLQQQQQQQQAVSRAAGSVAQQTTDKLADSRAYWVGLVSGVEDPGWQALGVEVHLKMLADEVATKLPSRCCCANPSCAVLRGMSEWQLVSGPKCVCGGCAAASGQAVRYCSRECQRLHWLAHKPVCHRLRQQQQQQQ